MKILIGYDGSADADGALDDLAQAGLPDTLEARVVTAVKPWMFGPEGKIPANFTREYDAYSRAAVKEARAQAERAALSLGDQHPGWTVRPQALLGDPARALLDNADRWKPGLIVVGSHGHSALGRLLVGSVSLQVLHHAKVSVRITRPRVRRKQGPPRILVAVDGSAGAEAALASAASRAWPNGTRVLVLGASEYRPNPGVLLGEGGAELAANFSAHQKEGLEKTVSAAAKRLARKGLRAEGAVKAGDPRAVLVDEAKAWDADCIFLGSRGLGAWDRILLGSVTTSVASHAPCTVEVIRSPAGKRAVKRADSGRGAA